MCAHRGGTWIDAKGVMLKVYIVSILSSSKNDVAIKFNIRLVINHY